MKSTMCQNPKTFTVPLKSKKLSSWKKYTLKRTIRTWKFISCLLRTWRTRSWRPTSGWNSSGATTSFRLTSAVNIGIDINIVIIVVGFCHKSIIYLLILFIDISIYVLVSTNIDKLFWSSVVAKITIKGRHYLVTFDNF